MNAERSELPTTPDDDDAPDGAAREGNDSEEVSIEKIEQYQSY